MALVVEDGTGLASAESFASVAAADTYHTARGNTSWAALTTTAKETRLRLATDYMEQVFASRWRGSRYSQEQALSFPRVDGIDANGFAIAEDEVPTLVATACIELALRASTSSTLLPDQVGGAGSVVETENTVGPITTRTRYSEGSTANYPQYPAVNAMLRPLLKPASGRVSR